MLATTNATSSRQKCLNSVLTRNSSLEHLDNGFDLPLSRGNWPRKTYLKLKQRPASRLCVIKVNSEFKRHVSDWVLG
ncbi:hypothetical protein V6N13_076228 [Hibiscus sabdariffa]